MQTYKRIISLLLAFVLVLSNIPATPVLAVEEPEEDRVSVVVTDPKGSMNLTEMGNADWLHFSGDGQSVGSIYKANGNVFSFELLGETVMESAMTNSKVTYSWTDGDPNETGSDMCGGVITYNKTTQESEVPAGNGWKISVPAHNAEQTLTFVAGIFVASGKVSVLVDDEVVFENTDLVSKPWTAIQKVFTVTVAPNVAIEVVFEFTEEANKNANASLGGITLNREASAVDPDQTAADAVIALINAIGEVTLEKEASIAAARTAYDALTEAQQALVTNIEALTVAEDALEELKNAEPDEPQVSVEVTDAAGSMNLTEMGNADWLHFNNSSSPYATIRKENANIITFECMGDGVLEFGVSEGDSKFAYSWTDGTPNKTGSDTSGGGINYPNLSKEKDIPAGNGWKISVPAYEGVQTLTFVAGRWATNGKISVIADDEVVYENTDLSDSARDSIQKIFAVTIAPNVEVEVRYDLTWKLSGSGNSTMGGITLNREAPSVDPDQTAADAVIALINEIGEVTLEKEAAITAARTAYDALTDAQQALVTNIEVLAEAEEALEELKNTEAEDPVVYVQVTDAAGSMNLTQMGNADWLHFNNSSSPYATIRKENANIITFEGIGDGVMEGAMDDSKVTYTWSDGTPNKTGSDNGGGVINFPNQSKNVDIPAGNGWKISVSAYEGVQTLTFVAGVWAAEGKLSIIADDEVVFENYDLSDLPRDGVQKIYTVTVAPNVAIEVRFDVSKKDSSYGNSSLGGITLNRAKVEGGDEDNEYVIQLAEAVEDAYLWLTLDGISDSSKTALTEAKAAAETAMAKGNALTATETNTLCVAVNNAIQSAKNSVTTNFGNVYAYRSSTSFGWEGDTYAPVLWIDGTYTLRGNKDAFVTFGVSNLGANTVDWYNAEGYLPCFVSEYAKDDMDIKIESFSDDVTIDSKRYEIAYSRMTVTNTGEHDALLPIVDCTKDGLLVPLNDAAKASASDDYATIKAGETIVREYCIGADRFGGSYSFPSAEKLAAAGSFDDHYAHMKTYWNNRLEGITAIESIPEEYEVLIDAYKAGYIYMLIIADGYELHVGERGYDRVYDHDVIGMLASLVQSGHTEHFADYAQYILQNVQYPDARWKYSWPFALYLQKTGDYQTIKNHWSQLKSNTHDIASSREACKQSGYSSVKTKSGETAKIMKKTNAIDSNGYWTIDNYASLFGLTTYAYICEQLYAKYGTAEYKTEYDWAKAEYKSLMESTEAVLAKTQADYGIDYIPISMVMPNEQSERKDPQDGNWAAHYLFGRWDWDGYLFGADQDSWMHESVDKTYTYIMESKSEVFDSIYNMGGYPHGYYSSAYNAGYFSAALSGETYRDGGIQAYMWMIENSQGSPFGWWEGIAYPNEDENPWNINSGASNDSGGSCPHMWGQSTATKVLIDSFLAEKADGTIIAGRGLPLAFNADGETVSISNFLCNSGKKIGFNMTTSNGVISFELTGDELTNPVSLELQVLKNNISSVSDACEVDLDAGTVLIPAGIRQITIGMGDTPDETIKLAQAKANAIKELKAAADAVDQTEYSEAQKQTITDAVDSAKIAINAAESEDAVEAALTAGKTAVKAAADKADADNAAADQVAADAVMEKIAALPDEITLEDEDAVVAARAAYKALSNKQKNLVTNLDKLIAAEEVLQELRPMPVVQVSDKAASGSMNLTEMGNADWMHFSGDSKSYVMNRKAGGDIIDFELIGGTQIASGMNNSKVAYSWTDGTPNETGSDTSGCVINYNYGTTDKNIPANVGWKLSIPADDSVQTLTFVVGVWQSSGKISVLANGDVVYQSKELTADNTAVQTIFTVTVSPHAAIEVVFELTAEKVQWCNITLGGVSLKREASSVNPDQVAANAVIAKINAIGEVTLEKEAAIIAARTAYSALTDAQKTLVSNIETLTAAEAKIEQLKEDAAQATAVDALIGEIGEVTLESEEKINAARAAYDALTDAQKALVEKLEVLTAAEDKIEQLKEDTDQAAVAAVGALIGEIGEVTLESEDKIGAAREAYDALSDEQKEAVTNYQTLLEAEQKYAVLVSEKNAQDAAAAKDAAEQAKAAAEKALEDAEAAQAKAEEAKTAAEKAKAEAEAAQVAAEEAEQNAGEDASAAADAKAAAEAAQTKAEAAQRAAETAQSEAETAQEKAEIARTAAEAAEQAAAEHNESAAEEAAKAAKEAAKAAEEALKSTTSATESAAAAAESASFAAKAAESAKAAQIAQKAAEEAQAKAEAAQKAAEEERKAAEEAKAAAEAAQKAAEAVRKAAAEAALNGAKYQAAMNLDTYANLVDQSEYDAKQVETLAKIVSDAKTAIAEAENTKEIDTILSEAKLAIYAVDDVCPSKGYTDVAKNAWYHDYVDFMVDNGYMNGVSDTKFDVNGSVTRAQLVTILYRVAGEPSVEGLENFFTDVADGKWYTNAIIWAASEEVVKGVTATEFKPNDAITRQQIVTILYRYDGAETPEKDNLTAFKDADKIAAYAKDAMNWAVGEGIISGMDDVTLAPAETATRAQICAIVMRYLEN